jgi:hypothetical protein
MNADVIRCATIGMFMFAAGIAGTAYVMNNTDRSLDIPKAGPFEVIIGSNPGGDAILTISNDAGAVTTVRNLSDRECHAAALLLTESRPVAGGTFYFTTIGGSQQPSSPRTPELTKAECLHPEGKKP